MRAARQHFVTLFGKPEKALAFAQPTGGQLRAVEVGLFGTPPSPVALVTAGASAVACADGVKREWMLLMKRHPAHDAAFAALAGMASMAPKIGELLLIDEPKPFVAVVVLDARAIPAEHRSFRRQDGVTVEVGWMVPVQAPERAYIEQHGAEAMWAHWAAARPDLADLARAPSVPT